jgi:outer membrane receptor protein involved in Fe transport
VSQADHAAIPDNDADRGDEDDEAAQDDDPGFKATPYFAVSAGHDSNIDEEENGPASTFVRANAAIDVNYERGIADLDLRLAATFIDVVDLADNERWEYAADAGLTLEVADNTDVIIEYDREHEAISDPETISNEGSVGVEIETRRYTLLLRGLVENEQNLSGDTDFGSDPANSFDFIKGGGHGRLRLNTGGVLSPFVDLRAMVSFFPNENKAVIDRDATSYALIAGTIIALGDDFELALGGRYNHRGLKDVNIPTVANGFIDASLNWKPVDQFLITGSVSRQINEAGIEDSVASVETSFALAAIWTPDDQWQLDTRISYVESDDVGASEIEQEFEIGARLSYAVAEQFSLFAATSFLVSRTEVDSVLDERHTRLRAEAGVESRF